MFKRLTAGLAALALSCAQVAAAPPLMGNIIGKQAFHGPGSRGFLPTCSANFSVSNLIPQSNSFSSWTLFHTAGAITFTTGVADPTGGAGATTLTIPTVTSGQYSIISETISSTANNLQYTFGVWAQMPKVGGVLQTNGTVYIMQDHSGTLFSRMAIPNDGNWHYLALTPAPNFYTTFPNSAQIGVDPGQDSGQSASTGSLTVNVFQASVSPYPISKYQSYIATTSAAVTTTQTIPCPPGVAFRNFNPQLPSAGLSPTNLNALPNFASNLYESGGVSNPFVTPSMFYGGYYWAFVNATSAATHGDWMSFALYKSRDKINWVEDTLNAPYLQTFGSILAQPTVSAAGSGYGTSVSGTMTFSGCTVPLVISVTTTSGGAIGTSPAPAYVSGSCATFPGGGSTAWTPGGGLSAGTGATFTFASVLGTGGTNASVWFQLHPQWLPYGCNVSGTSYPFCIIYTGNSTSGGTTQEIYLAYSATINGVYTPYGCTAGGGVCAVQTPITPSGFSNQYAASVVNVGGINGTNYIYSMIDGQTSISSNVFTTPANPGTAGAGTTLTPDNFSFAGLQTNLSTDWDHSASGADYKQDNHVYHNRCGFYEYFYTATNTLSALPGGLHQLTAYLVSNSPTGPWWKYNAPIIPTTSTLINGTNNIGDPNVTSINGRYIFWSNSDAGVNPSKATTAMMQDACAY